MAQCLASMSPPASLTPAGSSGLFCCSKLDFIDPRAGRVHPVPWELTTGQGTGCLFSSGTTGHPSQHRGRPQSCVLGRSSHQGTESPGPSVFFHYAFPSTSFPPSWQFWDQPSLETLTTSAPVSGKPRTNQGPSLLLKAQMSNSALFLKLRFPIRSPSLKASNRARSFSVAGRHCQCWGSPSRPTKTYTSTRAAYLLVGAELCRHKAASVFNL